MFDAHHEPASGETRSYRYEILLCREGRWTVESLMDSPAEAKARARALLARGACDEVKVLRHRARRGGQSVSSEILHETRPAKSARPGRRLSAGAEPAEGCRTLHDFSGWESRRFLATLFQDYLSHHALIPSELIFDWRHGRRLFDEDALVNDAVQRVARTQARRDGVAPPVRAKALDALVAQAVKRARELGKHCQRLLGGASLTVGALPALDGRAGDADGHGAAALATACLTRQLTGTDNHEVKIARLLELLPGASPPWDACIETMMAECLLFPDALQALFAPRLGAGAPLERLIDLVERRPAEEGAQEAPLHAALAYLIGLDSAPHCAAALEGWIAILLASKEPLDPADPQREGRLLELLGRRLRRVDGRWIGGEAARRALENRRRRLREASLRKIGLESTADALGRRR